MGDYDYDEDIYDNQEEYDDEDAGFSYKKTKSLRPYHLNSALTPHWLNDLKSGAGDYKIKASWRNLNAFFDTKISDYQWEPIQFYLLFGTVCQVLDPRSFEADALEITRVINSAEQLSWQGATEFISEVTNSELQNAVQTDYYRHYDLQANMFSTIVLLMNSMSSGRLLPSLSPIIRPITPSVFHIPLSESYHLYITDSIVIGVYDTQQYIMNYDSMLMCSDLAKQRRLVMGMTYVGNKIFPENYPTQSNLGELFHIVDEGLRCFGNNFYKVVKTFEPLCVGAIMKTKIDHFVDNSEFFDTIFSALLTEEPSFEYLVNQIVTFLTSEKNPRWIAQYFGLYRIWGHPVVDVTAGIKKVMDLGLKETPVNDHTTIEAERNFKYIFMDNYRKKHHHYPNVTVLGKYGSWFVSQILENRELPRPGLKWQMSDLDYLDFAETFKPPATFNLTSIIADKAVSPSRSELQNLIRGGKNTDPNIRRGVLKWLRADHVSCKEILKIVNAGEFLDDWCIIGVYPKEREENIKPRLFALMSFELRLYVVVTEEMLSDNILDYFPQITMTHSQLDLTKSIFTATRHQSTSYSKKVSNLVTISISMDFEKWNIKMRKAATYRTFRQLGLLFGMEHLYTATHDILSRCYIYLADGSYTPPESLTPDFIRSWIGHLGGFEGLRQKGWTIFTACLIQMVCASRDVSFKLMGQGDNQVVQLIFRLNHTSRGSDVYDERDVARIKNVTESIIKELEATFNSVGMTLKISETWRSSHLFSYGKNMVFDGVPLPLSLKKGARSFYESNEGIMVLDTMMATINTNCQAAAYQDLTHHVAQTVARYESYIMCRCMIEYHPLLGVGLKNFSKRPWKSRDLIYDIGEDIPSYKVLAGLMIAVPRMLGGYNTTCFFEYIMRGFPDPLTRDLRYMNLLLCGLKRIDSHLARQLYRYGHTWYDLTPNPTVDKAFLIQDPLALNLLGPKSPMDAMRSAVEDILQSSDIKNKPFKRLIGLKNKRAVDQIATLLWSAQKLNSRLGHDIYQATPYGYVAQSLARIENTNTIRHIAYQRSSKDIIDIIGDAEVNKFSFFLWKCTQISENRVSQLLNICTRVYAEKAREVSWGKPLVGVTVPFPDEYLIMSRQAKKITNSDQDGYFIVGFNEHSAGNRERILSSLGPSPPYLGSVTREKTRQTSDASVFKAESLIKRPLKLQRAIGWFIPDDSNLAALIQQTLSCVCDLDPVEFKTTDWESTGSHIHRYHDTVTKKGVLVNYSYLPGTHMYLSSDLLVKYSQSKANVTIVYQACLVYQQYLAWILQLEHMMRGRTPIRALCWSVGCKCVQEVDESFDDISMVPSDFLPENKGNDLLWVDKRDLVIHHSSKLRSILSAEIIPVEGFSERYLHELFHVAMAKRIATDIFSGDISEDTEARMVDSTSRYPRVYYNKMDLQVLSGCIINWLHVFFLRRVGVIGLDIRPVQRVKSDIRDRLQTANAICFQGLGLFFTNRGFCEKALEDPTFPKPNTYPYTLRAVGLAMKEYLIDFLDTGGLRVNSFKLLPVEFSNLEEEVISLIYYRVCTRKSLCLKCLKEVSLISSSVYKKYCNDHVYLEDLFLDGKIQLKYVPVTVDRLSKTLKAKLFTKQRVSRVGNLDVPKCRVLLRGVVTGIRQGNFSNCPESLSKDLPIMGMAWQKYARAANQPTASRYKWSCVIADMKRQWNCQNIVVFGDGLGGVSDLLNLFFPEAELTVISYLNVADAINHSTIGCIPPEYRGSQDRLDVYFQANKVNDVLSPDFRRDWANMGHVFDTTVSDVELPRDISTDSYLFYVQNLASIQSSRLVLKAYFKDLYTCVNVTAILATYYESVDILTCATANLHYNEVFLFCSRKRETGVKWLFSLPSFDQKITTTFETNGPSTWNPVKEARLLEGQNWILPDLMRAYKILDNWFARSHMREAILAPHKTAGEIIKVTRQAIYSVKRRSFSHKKKIPYHQLLHIAQRMAAALLIYCDTPAIVRYYLENPDAIEVTIKDRPGEESVNLIFTHNKGSNKENWDQTLRCVAIGRRLKELPLTGN
ncbi:TPA_asm: L [Picris trirhavirus 1]|nr:MAG: replicase polyprotein (domains: RNA-dependent RNA polymerase, mRNA cap, methyl transferase) [Picris cytorhabdovirus 1]DBA36568.1 TPA_asm: L [Picris trirhavirus 1]